MDAADLLFAGITRQADMVRRGEVTARDLVEASLDRIARLDPQVNAFRVVLAEQARTEAAQADARQGAGEDRPLLGVPVAVKDDCAVAGQLRTFGTNAASTPCREDAEIVRRLRRAGAIVVGITNVPELTITPFTESPTNGATRNPWNLQRTPGGSSGGSAAAVAAGMVGAAVASDGGGSIRIPAGCCGLVGLKPQRGRVPTAPLVEPWNGLSTWGAITRSVEDTALFLDVVSEPDAPSLTDAARRAPGPLRIGMTATVPKPLQAKTDDEQRGAAARLADALRGLGHTVVEREVDYGPGGALAFLARYFRGIHDSSRLLDHPERLERRTRGYVRIGRSTPPAPVARARVGEAADRERMNRVFGDVDLLLTPMFTRRPVAIGEWEGAGALRTHDGVSRWVPFAAAWNHTGQPAISVPAGFTEDRFPLAAQLVAPPDGDALLVSVAAQLQEAIGWTAERPPVS